MVEMPTRSASADEQYREKVGRWRRTAVLFAANQCSQVVSSIAVEAMEPISVHYYREFKANKKM